VEDYRRLLERRRETEQRAAPSPSPQPAPSPRQSGTLQNSTGDRLVQRDVERSNR
jgi:hypothetical protein